MTKQEFLQQVKFDKPTVYILRGIPGSGKSTIVDQIGILGEREFTICSADLFFMLGGEYKFDHSKIKEAHQFCLRDFCDVVFNKWQTVFLDNTNTTISEFTHYVNIAEAYSYKVVLVTLNINIETSIKRNVHRVPEKTIKGMYERLNNIDNTLKLNRFCRDHNIEHFNIDNEPV